MAAWLVAVSTAPVVPPVNFQKKEAYGIFKIKEKCRPMSSPSLYMRYEPETAIAAEKITILNS